MENAFKPRCPPSVSTSQNNNEPRLTRTHGIPAIINAYLLVTLPFDIAHCRTLWMLGSVKAISVTFSSSIGIKCMILITEAVEKRSILLDRYRYISPEATSGIYSRSFFFWLNNLSMRRVSSPMSYYSLWMLHFSPRARILLLISTINHILTSCSDDRLRTGTQQ